MTAPNSQALNSPQSNCGLIFLPGDPYSIHLSDEWVKNNFGEFSHPGKTKRNSGRNVMTMHRLQLIISLEAQLASNFVRI